MTSCAWCELDVDTADRQSIRLSSTQPPWSVRSAVGAAARITAVGDAFAATLRAALSEEPPITLWFHRACWHAFLELLAGLIPALLARSAGHLHVPG